MKEYAHKRLFFKAEGITVTFYCHAENTRNGFKHVAEMFADAPGVTYNKSGVCYYYNRTWEVYSFQSVCSRIVRDALEYERARLQWQWMEAHGYERMSAKRREAYEAEHITSDLVKFLETLAFCVDGRPRVMFGPSSYGARENEVLENLGNVERMSAANGHRLYKMHHADGTRFVVWDANDRRFVG